jgi:hypothetical protein
MGKKHKNRKKAKEKESEEQTTEISEKQFDDTVITIIRECEKKVHEAEEEMQGFVRMHMDKQRNRTFYPNVQLEYYIKKGKERSDVGYRARQIEKIGFV